MRSGQVWPTDRTGGTDPRTVLAEEAGSAEEVVRRGTDQEWRFSAAHVFDGSVIEPAAPGLLPGRSAVDTTARVGALPPTPRAADWPPPVATDEAAGQRQTDTGVTDWLFETGVTDWLFEQVATCPLHAVFGGEEEDTLQPSQGVDTLPAGEEAEHPRFDEVIRAPSWRYYASLSMFSLGIYVIYQLGQRKSRAAAPDASRSGQAGPGRSRVRGGH
jgi:hypothetical protein